MPVTARGRMLLGAFCALAVVGVLFAAVGHVALGGGEHASARCAGQRCRPDDCDGRTRDGRREVTPPCPSTFVSGGARTRRRTTVRWHWSIVPR